MKIHQLSIDDALKSLGSNSRGLSSAEARRRLAEYGPNRIEKVVPRHPLLHLASEFVQLFSLILWVAAALAFVAEWFDPGVGMARVGYAVVGVIVISGLFSFWQEHRVEQTLAALQKLLPQTARVLRGGFLNEVVVEELVVGDLMLLEQGDNVPADCRLVEALRVRVRDKLLAHLKAQSWAHTGLLNATVNDGVVDLWGITSSATERKAIRVAAEATVGVRTVNDHMMVRRMESLV
jgi:magnesium-transporting ATPase (P-type)